MSQTLSYRFLNQRLAFVLIGLLNIVIFGYAICRLWFFLLYMESSYVYQNTVIGILVNLGLIAYFSVGHSLLLSSKLKIWLSHYIPKGLYYSFYSMHACSGILLMDHYWSNLGGDFFKFSGSLQSLIMSLYVISWAFMFWSMLVLGLGKQNGVEDWWLTLRGKKLRHKVPMHGPYLLTRHPIYISFLGMIWTSPNISLGHLMMSLIWSFYIFYGIAKKESRMLKSQKYSEYAQHVPVFPFSKVSFDNYLFAKIRSLI